MGSIDTVIGHVTISKPFRHQENYEIALWYREHEVQPGTYEVRCSWHALGNKKWIAEYVTVTYTTKIADVFMPTLFGGRSINGDDTDRSSVGKASEVTYGMHAFLAPAELADGERAWLGGVFTPVDGVHFERGKAGSKPVMGS